MPAKPNARNWNDVQTAIVTAAIVTTIGLWNLFSTPAKTVTAQAKVPTDTSVPPTEPPVTSEEPAAMPQVKIMFTQVSPQAGPQTVTVQQSQQQPQVKKKKKNNSSSGSGGSSVTQTKSS